VNPYVFVDKHLAWLTFAAWDEWAQLLSISLIRSSCNKNRFSFRMRCNRDTRGARVNLIPSLCVCRFLTLGLDGASNLELRRLDLEYECVWTSTRYVESSEGGTVDGGCIMCASNRVCVCIGVDKWIGCICPD